MLPTMALVNSLHRLQFGNRGNYYTSVLRESQLIKEFAHIRIQAEFPKFLSMIFGEKCVCRVSLELAVRSTILSRF